MPAFSTGRVAALAAAGLLLTAAGCGGSGGGSSLSLGANPGSSATGTQPSWASQLGPGATVTAPQKHPGADTPGAVALAAINDTVRDNLTALCGLVEPSLQAQCKQSVASNTTSPATTHDTNIALGYVATEGNEALVGFTGTVCDDTQNPPCATNTNPAAIFNGGGTFSVLYSQAANASDSDSTAYSLLPCIRENGKWYLFIPASGD